VRDELKRPGRTSELWSYLRTRKRWWLLPTLFILLLLGLFISFAEGSVAVPFIYTLF
jgi:hypothetical protein